MEIKKNGTDYNVLRNGVVIATLRGPGAKRRALALVKGR